MAQLKDLLVTGDARVLGSIYADIPTNDLVPYATKTYTNIIGNSSDNNQAYNSFYFGYVRPNSFTETWEAKYRVHVWVPTNTNFEVVSDVLFKGSQTNINAYAIFNHILNTSYRPVYYHNVYRLNATGYNNGYGHALGISLSDSNSRGDTSLKRSFTIELIYAKNCTITLNDTAVLWANWSGTGSTNYSGLSNYNFASNGLQETGDNDDVCQLRSYYERPLVDTGKLYGYNLCTLTNNDKLTGFVTSYSTGTTKTKNTATFKINAPMYYYTSNAEKASGSYTGDNSLAYQLATVDFRYSSNCGTTLTANKPVYLVGIPNGTTYTLADTWWTQTLPSSADGKIYIYLGIAYDTYRIAWQVNHPIYWYKDGAIKLYIPSAGDLAYINKGSGSSKFLREDGTWQTVSSGGGTITDVKVDNQSIVSNGIANLNTSGYNADNNPLATAVDIQDLWDGMLEKNYTLNNSTGTAAWYEDNDKPALDLNIENEYYLDLNSNYIEMGQASSGNSITISSSGVSIGANQGEVSISNVEAPTNNKSAANKQYVDTQVATKQNTLVSGTNIKTINNQSLLGSGDLDIISGGDTLPVGAIIPYSGSTIPTNFLLADGSAVSRTTYSELFEAIGTTYGAGDGSTTFNLPNLKGKVPVGRDSSDTSFDVLGETGGEKTHQLTVNEMPSHAHDAPIHSGGSQGLLGFMGLTNGSSSATLSGGSTFGVKNTGGSQAHNNLQPYITQNYIIKAKKSTTALDLGYITDSYSDSTTDAYSANMVNSLVSVSSGNDTLPIGAIIPFSGNSIPTNYLLADGSAVSRTTYNELFDTIGTTYGTGDGSTTFNLPNLKGRIPVGLDSSDTSFDTLGETGGEKTHQLTVNEMPSHTHDQYVTANNGNQAVRRDYSSDGNSAIFPQGCKTASTGGGQPHNNLQPYITQKYLIKVKMSTSALSLGLVTDAYSESTTDTYSANFINNLLKNLLLDNIYPIGSIYMSTNNTNPNTLFGGIWESWGAGRVPVGVDTNDADFDTAEETGGEKTHTLTTNEMPSHGHSVTWASNCSPWVQAGGYGQITATGTANTNRANLGGITINNAGGSGAHNNLQPYITCYMWKRTA